MNSFSKSVYQAGAVDPLKQIAESSDSKLVCPERQRASLVGTHMSRQQAREQAAARVHAQNALLALPFEEEAGSRGRLV